ncbi:response regulator transcription factor [Roseateles amylovorans]|jgi:DNA-binding response OmpR family regulator|uniref:DNA-binding response regulator n=1 Tax=Roseateles amylovorans TaxID=2978473 RepID=A0ABY6B4U0_9BURK|nr:DNA-binding response regulator [Roseateles amylovorans]UXH79862.1 DNA-binding response regulator [Roseateles amylovorans]
MSFPVVAQENRRPLLLLVDDQPEELKWLTELLQPRYRLAFADGGRAGLHKAQALRPDLILLDINLPDMDGFAVCRLLKSDPATVAAPVLFLSAQGDVNSRVDGLTVGGVDFITKPFHPEEVLARVRVHLQLAAGRAATAREGEAPTEGSGLAPGGTGAMGSAAAGVLTMPTTSPEQRLAAAAQRYIQDHLAETLTVSLVARQVGLSERRLLALFREQLGHTVSGFISEERVRTGQRLLAETDMSVQDVAAHVGFSNPGNFATAFRERHGISPQAYRQALRAGRRGNEAA